MKKEIVSIRQYLKSLITVFVERAQCEIDILMPGYTHMQVRAQIHVLYVCRVCCLLPIFFVTALRLS